MTRRYAAIHHVGVSGTNDGSHPSGFTPRIASKTSCSRCWNASLRARSGIAAKTKPAIALSAVTVNANARPSGARIVASPQPLNTARSGTTSTR